ncbi:MAG: pyruvate kinase [Gammaproteobacteria bacterium]|nr:pyruvate kinase [Gammaproteobacteria bacterium]
MRRNRKAKIVATLGPASSTETTIKALHLSGVDVFRLNFSHGSHQDHRERVEIIRRIEHEVGHPIGILMDIQGPKLRLGKFDNHSVELVKGDTYRLDLDEEKGDQHRVSLLHPEIFAALNVGSELMIDDGRVRLKVTEATDQYVVTQVMVGGVISDHKGVNIPGVVLPISVITEKDRIDLEYSLSLDVDWVAQSFVQQPEDVRELRTLVNGRAAIMVKLEKPSALEHLDEILELCDGVMVARGDLGVELPPEQVPIVQKHLIRKCRQVGKPVVIATHMLDSMVHVPVPTRAEASDVATAIYDGADAVMLSAESAAGDYPVQSVTMMDKIIHEVEQDPVAQNILDAQRPDPNATTADAICNALQKVTHVLSSTATVTYTSSGSTTLRAARERPRAPILSLTPEIKIARYLCVAWGVHPVLVSVANEDANLMEVINTAKDIAVREDFAKLGDAVVIAAGLPFGVSGTTNLLHVAWID